MTNSNFKDQVLGELTKAFASLKNKTDQTEHERIRLGMEVIHIIPFGASDFGRLLEIEFEKLYKTPGESDFMERVLITWEQAIFRNQNTRNRVFKKIKQKTQLV